MAYEKTLTKPSASLFVHYSSPTTSSMVYSPGF